VPDPSPLSRFAESLTPAKRLKITTFCAGQPINVINPEVLGAKHRVERLRVELTIGAADSSPRPE
jgi:hypothetical protein